MSLPVFLFLLVQRLKFMSSAPIWWIVSNRFLSVTSSSGWNFTRLVQFCKCYRFNFEFCILPLFFCFFCVRIVLFFLYIFVPFTGRIFKYLLRCLFFSIDDICLITNGFLVNLIFSLVLPWTFPFYFYIFCFFSQRGTKNSNFWSNQNHRSAFLFQF